MNSIAKTQTQNKQQPAIKLISTPVGDVLQTQQLNAAVALVKATATDGHGRMAKIHGLPGSGKTHTCYALAKIFDGVRICAYSGMRRKTLFNKLAERFGGTGSGGFDSSITFLQSRVENEIFLIDECNHLGWLEFEALRYLSDECGAVIVLLGTQIFEQKFVGKSGVYLQQLSRRIGAKHLELKPVESLEECVQYFILPNFDTKPTKSTAALFLKVSGGLWGRAAELTTACKRLMESNPSTFEKLTTDLVAAAAKELG